MTISHQNPVPYAPMILADETLTADAAAFTAVTIPDGIKEIEIKLNFHGSTNNSVVCRFNNDNGANYDYQTMDGGADTTIAASREASKVYGFISHGQPANQFHKINCKIDNSNTTLKRIWLSTAGGYDRVTIIAGHWTTDLINTILIMRGGGNYLAGSRLQILGWK